MHTLQSTRAKEKLYLTHSAERMLYGRTDRNRISRFVKELPKENIDKMEEDGLSSALSGGNSEMQVSHSMSLQNSLLKTT